MRGHNIYIVVLLLGLLLFGYQSEGRETPTAKIIKEYKQIPGITNEEIKAIEELKGSYKQFIYAMNVTTNAFLTEDKEVDGFARLLSERLSELFGIKFVPQLYTWEELNKRINAFSVDFTGELSPTPERKKRYFMTDPMFNRKVKIFTNKHSPELETVAQERPIKVGFLNGAYVYTLVENSWELPFEPYFLSNEEEAIALLESGALDAYIEESSVEILFEQADFIKTADYFPLRYVSMSLSTANPQLKPIIDVVQKYLKAGGFQEIANMYKDGATIYAKQKLLKGLTAAEKNYIKNHNTPETAVLIGVEYDNYPIAFYNIKEKKFQGIALDVLKQVTLLTGIEFKINNSPKTQWNVLLDELEAGRIALITEMVPLKERSNKFTWTATSYNSDYYALLSLSDHPDMDINQVMHTNIGLVQGSSAAEVYKNWFPGSVNDTFYPDYLSAFAALEKGEVDLMMATQAALSNLTNYLEKPGFKANITFQHPAMSTFGLNKNETVLRSILDKSMSLIETADIVERWKRKVFDYSSKFLKDIMPYTIVALLLLAVGLVAVVLLLLKNRKMSKNLEQTVVERTSELQHASRAKTDFLSSMSHEMRTPMNAIIGMAKIAEKANDINRLRYCLNAISASSTHLLGLINDILDMSKIEAGKLELHNAPLDIEKMLMQICNMILDKTEQKSQTLHVFLDSGMHFNYSGDELRLSQVITNLLSNAVKFTPDGGVISISVREERKNDKTSMLRFSIADNGIGMTQEQVARLFSAFTQANGEITKKFGGTGLGLAISKSIVEKMNGKIWVESEQDKGSTFIFEVELESMPQVETTRTLLGHVASEVKALVIDNDNAQGKHLSNIITSFGIHCDTAQHIEEAQEFLNTAGANYTPYNVIFINPSPTDVLGSIRQIWLSVDARSIVIISSFLKWNRIEDKLGKMGITRVIAKPIFPSAVLNSISDVLGNALIQVNMPENKVEKRVDLSGIRILLVEDVDINREVFISLLEDTGITIESAENGLQAVEMFGNNPEKYDAIIMDIQMPVMDGYEATRIIRQLPVPEALTVPIIAMTANAFREDVEKCLESGMSDHSVKPIDVEDIIEKIRKWTEKNPQ